jgi:hypothetical protein
MRLVHVVPTVSIDAPLGERLERAQAGVTPTVAASDLPGPLDPTSPLASGRAREARRLRWWWRLARRGEGREVTVTGPSGIGKTRLLAEPGLLAARDGAVVRYASGRSNGDLAELLADADKMRGPALLVFDDLEATDERSRRAVRALAQSVIGKPIMVVAAIGDGAPPTNRAERRASDGFSIALTPFDRASVADVVALYAAGAEAPPIDAIAEASAGVPAEIHRLASQWARGEAARRLGDAVARAAEGRSGLRAQISTSGMSQFRK